MKTEFKTKYCTVSFHEDHDGAKTFVWAAVGMAWAESHDNMSKVFSHLMDDRLLEEARVMLADAVDKPSFDIRLEDADLLVNFSNGKKHLGACLIGLVKKIEGEFDEIVSRGNMETRRSALLPHE